MSPRRRPGRCRVGLLRTPPRTITARDLLDARGETRSNVDASVEGHQVLEEHGADGRLAAKREGPCSKTTRARWRKSGCDSNLAGPCRPPALVPGTLMA